MQSSLSEVKAEYHAAIPSRFRRTRTNLGGTADAHLANQQHFYDLREYARDMDRNDAVIGQLVDRAITNIVGEGLALSPDTGDEGLNREMLDRWHEWAENPLLCDAGGKFSFPEMEAIILRHEVIDGDVFILPLDDGTLQIVEGEWVDSPMVLGGDVYHGVRLDARRRPVEYWFVQEQSQNRFTHSRPRTYGPYDRRPAVDEDGQPVVLHIFSPQRVSQTRGVTAFRACFDLCAMLEDVNFAKLVQQQVVSCVAAFLEKSADIQWGARTIETNDDSTTRTLEELAPGLVIRGRPGEKLTAFSPNVPNADYFDHVRLILRLIGANIGMPLTLALLDTTNTTFHGYRGELQQAHLGFQRIRSNYPRRFHAPIYRRKVSEWLPDLGSAAAAANGRIYRHKWTGRGWPYIDPMTDAGADKLRLDNMLVSPRDLAAERGYEWSDIVRETVEDRALVVRSAVAASKAIEEETGECVHWRDLMNLAAPSGMQCRGGEAEAPKPATRGE